jgi:hypothetical protein
MLVALFKICSNTMHAVNISEKNHHQAENKKPALYNYTHDNKLERYSPIELHGWRR